MQHDDPKDDPRFRAILHRARKPTIAASHGERKEIFAKQIVDQIEFKMLTFPWEFNLLGGKTISINDEKITVPKSAYPIWELIQKAREGALPYSTVRTQIVDLCREINDEANQDFFNAFLQPDPAFGITRTAPDLLPTETKLALETKESAAMPAWLYGIPFHTVSSKEEESLIHAKLFDHFREAAEIANRNIHVIKASMQTMQSTLQDAIDELDLETKLEILNQERSAINADRLILQEKIETLEAIFSSLKKITNAELVIIFKDSNTIQLEKIIHDEHPFLDQKEKNALNKMFDDFKNATTPQQLTQSMHAFSSLLLRLKKELDHTYNRTNTVDDTAAQLQKMSDRLTHAKDKMHNRIKRETATLARQMSATTQDELLLYENILVTMNQELARDAIAAMLDSNSNPSLMEKMKLAHQHAELSLKNYVTEQRELRKSLNEKYNKLFSELLTSLALYSLAPGLGAVIPSATATHIARALSASDNTSAALMYEYNPHYYQENNEMLSRALNSLAQKIADHQITIGAATAAFVCMILFPPSVAVLATGAGVYMAGKTILDFSKRIEATFSDTVRAVHAMNAQMRDNDAFFGTPLKTTSSNAITTAKMLSDLEKTDMSTLDPKLTVALKNLEVQMMAFIDQLEKSSKEEMEPLSTTLPVEDVEFKSTPKLKRS